MTSCFYAQVDIMGIWRKPYFGWSVAFALYTGSLKVKVHFPILRDCKGHFISRKKKSF